MKKMIAILVALMLLAMPFASAESVLRLANPTLSMNMNGETMNFDLTGTELCLALNQLNEDTVALKLFINGNGETLFAIDANLTASAVLVSATGLSKVLSVPIPEELLQSIEKMDLGGGFQLPEEVTEKISNIVMSAIEVDEETGAIRVPHTALNDVLTEVLPYLDQAPVPGLNTEEVKKAIEDMKANDSGFDLIGTFDSAEDGSSSAVFSLYPVQNGELSETPLGTLGLDIADNGFTLTVDVGDEGALTLSFVDGLFTLAFQSEKEGMDMALTCEIGATEADVELVELDAANAVDVTALSEEDIQTLSNELMGGATGLLGHVFSALQNPAA